MTRAKWIPEGLSLEQPNSARIYDYLLGGYHNFEADRMVAKQVLEIYPDMGPSTLAHRAFLRRVVKFIVGEGIEQLLDIGSGIPTVGNVHEVAQAANPAARVVYVDIDSVAIAHSRPMLEDNANATAIRGDVRQPDQILDHPEVKDLLDFSQPVAVLLLAMLHMVTDDDVAYAAVRTLRDALVPGSYLAIAHGSLEGAPPDAAERATKLFTSAVASKPRSRAQILAFFEGLELVEPGLVRSPLWRPEGPDDVMLDRTERYLAFGGVGRKP